MFAAPISHLPRNAPRIPISRSRKNPAVCPMTWPAITAATKPTATNMNVSESPRVMVTAGTWIENESISTSFSAAGRPNVRMLAELTVACERGDTSASSGAGVYPPSGSLGMGVWIHEVNPGETCRKPQWFAVRTEQPHRTVAQVPARGEVLTSRIQVGVSAALQVEIDTLGAQDIFRITGSVVCHPQQHHVGDRDLLAAVSGVDQWTEPIRVQVGPVIGRVRVGDLVRDGLLESQRGGRLPFARGFAWNGCRVGHLHLEPVQPLVKLIAGGVQVVRRGP